MLINGYTDIHTHILPGVDDGAADMEQAMELVRMAYQNGTRTVFVTPHYRGRYKQNDPSYLRKVFNGLQKNVARELPQMQLYLGSEIHYEIDAPDALLAGKILSLNDSQYCLLEFSPGTPRSQIIMGISEVIRRGFSPIIAHAERYEAFRKNRALPDEVLVMGALIQLNAESVMGRRGLGVSMFCARLLKEQKAHFIATDAHNITERPPLLRECWRKIYKKYGQDYAVRLFYENAQAVIEDRVI